LRHKNFGWSGAWEPLGDLAKRNPEERSDEAYTALLNAVSKPTFKLILFFLILLIYFFVIRLSFLVIFIDFVDRSPEILFIPTWISGDPFIFSKIMPFLSMILHVLLIDYFFQRYVVISISYFGQILQ
jgi:hypothetical protein